MKVIKPQKLGLIHRVFESDGRAYLVISIMVFFPLDAPKNLLTEVSLWKLAGEELAAENGILDEGLSKVRGEVLVTGSCYVPHKKPAAVSYVRVKIGSVDKRLAVIGDRLWKYGVPTAPEPFLTMPIDWSRAFGGPSFPQNPLGRGAAPVESEGGVKTHPMPNIEDPKRLIVSPGDKPAPMGFGAYDIMWPQRASKAGTYDAKWLETRFPGVAADIDLTFYNVAPQDQWIDGYFRGDEAFLIENMHPDHPRIEGQLAGVVARAIIEQSRPDGKTVFRDIATRLETVRFFPHRLRGVLIYRGMVEIDEDDAADVKHLLIACEDPAHPRPLDHYKEVLAKRIDKEKNPLEGLRDRDLMPPPEAGWSVLPKEEDLDVGKLAQREDFLRKNMRRRQELEVAQRRAYLESKGLNPSDFGLDLPPEDELPPDNDFDGILEYMEKQEAAAVEQRKEMEAKAASMDAQARKVFADNKIDYDKAAAEAKSGSSGPPQPAKSHIDSMRQLLKVAREGGSPMPDLEAQLDDPEYLASLAKQDAERRELYRMSAHEQTPVTPLRLEQCERVREEVRLAHHNGISLAKRDFTGVDLSELDLSGVDLQEAFLESTNLRGTNLSGAKLEGAVLARADLTGAKLVKANLARANLGAASIIEADLSGADMTDAILSKTKIARSTFQGATLRRVQLVATEIAPDVDWTGVVAPQLMVVRVNLKGVKFVGATLTQATFVELSIAGADFSGADISKAGFITVDGDGALFRGVKGDKVQFVHGSSLEGADFSEASLHTANFRGTKLARAIFGRANITSVDFSTCDMTGANLYQAVARSALCVRTNFTGAGMISIDFLGAILQKSIFFGADLTGANLFRADLAKIRVDGRTKVGDTNMKQARVLPRYRA